MTFSVRVLQQNYGCMYTGKKVGTRPAWRLVSSPGFNLSNINHETCYYTDDVARMCGRQSQQHRELPIARGSSNTPGHELCHRTDDITQHREPPTAKESMPTKRALLYKRCDLRCKRGQKVRPSVLRHDFTV
jgi:hypothetical protein